MSGARPNGLGIFQRVAAIEARLSALPQDCDLVALRDQLAQARAVIAAQADLIRLLAERLPLDAEAQRALAAVEVAVDPLAPPLALPEGAAMAEAVQPVLAARGVTLAELCGPRRLQRLVEARWAAMDVLVRAGFPRERIARFLRRDVSTVAHGLQQLRGVR